MKSKRKGASSSVKGLFIALIVIMAVGCVPSNRETPTPTPPEPEPPTPEVVNYKVQGITYILEDGELRSRSELRASVENEMGSISGLAQYPAREKVTVKAEKKEGPYRLRWFYEKDGKDGFTKEKGVIDVTTSDGAYNKVKDTSCEITFQITSDMMFIAIFTKEDDPVAPPTPDNPNPDDVEDGLVKMSINPIVGGEILDGWWNGTTIGINTIKDGSLADRYTYYEENGEWIIKGTEKEEEKNRINKGDSYLFVSPNLAVTQEGDRAWVHFNKNYMAYLQYGTTTETSGDLQMNEATGVLELFFNGIDQEEIYEVTVTYDMNTSTRFDLLGEEWEEKKEKDVNILTGADLKRKWGARLNRNSGDMVVEIEAKSASHNYKTTLTIPYTMGQEITKEVVFNKEIATEIPLTYTELIEDKSYWKEINQRAWNMIYPNIVTLPTNEVEELLHWWRPERRGSLPFYELAQGEANVLAITISPRGDWIEQRTHDKNKAWRVAFALADMSGNIKEIYPPVWYTLVPTLMELPCYITLPEGEYQLRVLINIPSRRHQWIDIQLVDCIRWDVPFSDGYTHEELEEYNRKLNPWGMKSLEPIPASWGDASEEMRKFNVIDRKNLPIWHTARIMDGAEQLTYGSSPHMSMRLGKSYQLKMDMYNKSSRVMRGKIVVFHQQKHWVTGDMSYAKFRDEERHKMDMEESRKSGSNTWDYVTGLDEFKREIGSMDVTLNPGSNELSIPIKKTKDTPYISYGLYYYPMVLMYWQPEGSRELIPLVGSFHHALNGMQKEGGDWQDWWSYDRIIEKRSNRVVSKFNPAEDNSHCFSNGLRVD